MRRQTARSSRGRDDSQLPERDVEPSAPTHGPEGGHDITRESASSVEKKSSLDLTEADVGLGAQPHHLVPPGAGKRAVEVLRRLEDEAPADVDQARGLCPEPEQEPGTWGEPWRGAEHHHGDATRGPVGAEKDEDVRGGYSGGGGGGGGGSEAFRSGSTMLWGHTAEVEGRADAGGRSSLTGHLDKRVPGWSQAACTGSQAAPMVATGVKLGREEQVRKVEQLISGGAANTGNELSHPERFGGRDGVATRGEETHPPPVEPPRYHGHLSADSRTIAIMGSQSAVRTVEEAISVHNRPPSPIEDAAGDVKGGVGAPDQGAAAGGGAAGAAAAAGRMTARSVGRVAERVAGCAADVATHVRDTARNAGQMLGSVARHLAKDASAAAAAAGGAIRGSNEAREGDVDIGGDEEAPRGRDPAP